MTRDDLARVVLIEVHQRCEVAQSRRRPPEWKPWEVWEYEADIKYGRLYSPRWFGRLTETEAGRVRMLRTVYRLADAGLLILVKTEGGRLERVRLTEAGRAAATELLNAETLVPVGIGT